MVNVDDAMMQLLRLLRLIDLKLAEQQNRAVEGLLKLVPARFISYAGITR